MAAALTCQSGMAFIFNSIYRAYISRVPVIRNRIVSDTRAGAFFGFFLPMVNLE
jgi:hypothetical protein